MSWNSGPCWEPGAEPVERNVTPESDDEQSERVVWDTGSHFAGRRFNQREYGVPGWSRGSARD